MAGVGTGEEGMEDMGTAEGMRVGMEEAMAEEGTVEENMVEVTAEEGVEEGTAEEGTKEGTAEEGREEATAEVDMGVEPTGVVRTVEPFIMVAPKAAWFTMVTAKATRLLRKQTPRLMPPSSLPILELSCGLAYLLQQTQP
jgi:hypothetical protein